MVDVTNKKELRAWLEDLPAGARTSFAARAALRSLPAALVVFDQKTERFDGAGFVLACCRASLTSATTGNWPVLEVSVELRSAALFAARSALSAAYSADSAALSAALSARSALSAGDSVDSAARSIRSTRSTLSAPSALSADSAALSAAVSDRTVDLFSAPLWPGGAMPEGVRDAWQQFEVAAPGTPWAFWAEWYRGMLTGQPLDWELQRRVALIPDEDWQRGPVWISEKIDEIHIKYLLEQLPQAETVYEDDAGQYEVKEQETDLSALIGEVLARAEFAFDLAISSNTCDLNEMCMAAKWLRYSFAECRTRPNALEQNLRMSRDIIQSKLEEGQYGADDALEVLVRVLDESALQLRADHPEVSKAVAARTQERLRAIDDDQRLLIAGRLAAMSDGTGPRLSAEFALDAETVRSENAVEAQAEAIKRGGNRAGKINLMERAKQAEGSGVMSATKIGMRAQSLWDLISQLF